MGYEIDFLSVGHGEKSGDALALRFGNLFGSRDEQAVVVVDGGFKDSGEKLVNHIKTYYDTDRVDIVVSTHPDDDHASGLTVVLEELTVGCLWMHLPWNHTDDIDRMFKDGRVTDNSVWEALRRSLDTARNLEKLATSKGIPIYEPFYDPMGGGLTDPSGCLRVVAPTQEFYESLLPEYRATPEPAAAGLGVLDRMIRAGAEVLTKVFESLEIETLDDSGETSAENNSSAILLLTVDGRSSLLTADAGIPALTHVADHLDWEGFDYDSLKFIQVPHHGSKRNAGPTILNRLVGPKLKEEKKLKTTFVSASVDGAPKHPAKKVTNAFSRRGAPVYATQGNTKWHHHNAPDRADFSTAEPLPFYNEVEE